MNATKFLFSTAAAVTVAGAIGLAYAQTNTYNPDSTPGMTGSTQTQTTTTGQTPTSVRDTQNQQQNAAPGSMAGDSSGSAKTPATTNMKNGMDSNMSDGTTSMMNDGKSNVRRNTVSRNGGTTTERAARPDRN